MGNLTLANQLTILRIMLIPAFVLLVVALLVMTTGQEDAAQAEAQTIGGAHAVARGGPLTAFLAVALYGAIIGGVLWWNLR